MTKLNELRSAVSELRDEVDALASIEDITPEDDQRLSDAVAEFEARTAELAEAEERQARIDAVRESRAVAQRSFSDLPNVNVNRSADPYDLDAPLPVTAGEARGRAFDAIERTVGLPDDLKQNATRLIERIERPDGRVSRHIIATGSPVYRSAFSKLTRGDSYMLNEDEKRSIDAVRAASLTDAAGGFAVPFTLDPTIIDTGSGSSNPFRMISRVEQITTDTWNGVSSAGVTATFAAEAAEAGDNAPTLAQPSITTRKAHAFVPFSVEIGGDWASIDSDVRAMFQTAKDDLEATVFATGAAGSNQPIGIVTALDGTASEVAPATVETFAVADVYGLEDVLPAKYRARASWVANKAIYNDIRQFDTAGGAAMWERIGAGQPAELLGYPAYEASAMDNGFNAAATADNFLLILGDFSNYVIADRVGMSVELVPHLFATANNRPSGQRGFYAWWRVGADSVNDNAFRMLNVATTA